MRLALFYRWFALRMGRKAVLLSILGIVLMNVVLAMLSEQILASSGGKAQIPDIAFGYTAEQLYTWFELYGERGRSIYAWIALGIDLVYPVIYTMGFIFFLTTAFEHAFPRQINSLYKLCLLPLLVFAADLIENALLSVALHSLPTQMPTLVAVASAVTQIKWLLLIIVLTTLIIAIIGYLVYKKDNVGKLNEYK